MESTLVVRHHFPLPLQLHRRNPPNCTARYCLGTTSKLQSSTNGRPHPSPFTKDIPILYRGVVHEFLVPEHGPYSSITHLTPDAAVIYSRDPVCGVQGYVLLCVGFPSSDLKVETQDEDEVYWLQFGRYFARGPIERDDYALELAMVDE